MKTLDELFDAWMTNGCPGHPDDPCEVDPECESDFRSMIAARDAEHASALAAVEREKIAAEKALKVYVDNECNGDADCPGKSDDPEEWCRACVCAWAIVEAGKMQARAESAEASAAAISAELASARKMLDKFAIVGIRCIDPTDEDRAGMRKHMRNLVREFLDEKEARAALGKEQGS